MWLRRQQRRIDAELIEWRRGLLLWLFVHANANQQRSDGRV
jgi:hypothetical protein